MVEMVNKWFVSFMIIGICFAQPMLVHSQEPTNTEPKTKTFQDEVKKGRGPTEIIADELEIDNNKKIAIYTGNVVVTQDETNIFANKLIVYANEAGNKLEKAVGVGDCRLVRDNITATGNTCTFYDADQKLEVEGNAKAWQEENTLLGSRLIAFLDKDVVEAYGDNNSQRAVMTLYPRKGSPSDQAEKTSGGIRAGSESEQVEKASDKKPSKLKEGLAKGNVPIVVTSDKVVLDNGNRTATYTGNVIAVKGTTELKAEKMVAYAQPEKDELLKIEVFDNVRITRENMLFTGDQGVYYDDTQTAILEGVNGNRARAEDKVKKSTLEAPIIEAYLATDKFIAKGPTTTSTTRGRVRTTLPGDATPEGQSKSEAPKKSEEKKTKNEGGPPATVTLYPGGRQ